MKTIFAVSIITVLSILAAPAGHAATITYFATLLGTLESPPNASPGTGTAMVVVDTGANTMRVEVQFSGLTSPTTASHIHCCTASPGTGNAGVATTTPTFPGFPLGVEAGTYDQTFDLTSSSSYNPAFVTAEGSVAAAETALLAGLANDETYLNIHTSAFPSGEIRGYLTVQAVPEPASLAILAMGFAGLIWVRRRIAA